MAKIGKIQEVPIKDLKPYERNAKQHPDDQIQMIADSISEFGFLSPCLIDKEFNIIAGHGRVLAAGKLGMKSVPCLFVEGLTEAQQRAYILADNRLSELGGWDMDLVQFELEALDDMGFDVSLTGFELEEEDYEIEEDDFEGVPPVEPKSKPGDVYALGNHRLMCGDSTNPEDVKNLMGGALADMLITDPLYNVALGSDYSGSADEARKLHRRTDGLVIANDKWDNDDDFIHFLELAFNNANEVMKEGAAFYIWYASNQASNFLKAVGNAGWQVRQTLIWNKSSFTLGRQDYQWKHEPCLYGWKDGASHTWQNDRKQSTVIDMDRPTRNDIHPTMKPVSLFGYQIQNNSFTGNNILDLFGGSGTTIIACEESNRNAYVMEYDPKYVDVIIERWEKMTGKKAELLN